MPAECYVLLLELDEDAYQCGIESASVEGVYATEALALEARDEWWRESCSDNLAPAHLGEPRTDPAGAGPHVKEGSCCEHCGRGPSIHLSFFTGGEDA